MTVSVRVANRRLSPASSWSGISLKWVLALLAVVVAVALFYLFTEVRALNLSYQMGQELKTRQELVEAGRRLRLELSMLRAPERLEREGRRQGLAPPIPAQMRVLP